MQSLVAQTHIPNYPLNAFIDHFYYFSNYEAPHVIDRFLPNGEVQVIFDLTDQPKSIYHNETLREIQSCRNVWFSGFRTKPITIPSGNENEMLIIQFKPGKAYPFLTVPMDKLTNTVVDAEMVMGREILSIRQRLIAASGPAEKFQLLERQLIKLSLKKLEKDPLISFAVSTILASPNKYSIRTLADRTGYSQKHLIKLFKEKVGVTPKAFLKVVRFQRAIQQIEHQLDIDWSAIVFDCGFYDQSHFIADFKHFSGFTPSAYLEQRGDFLNYVPVLAEW